MSTQDSDAESSISSQTRTKTPKHTFPLAHPPPKSTPCLRLSPRLLLQIQQLSITSNRHRALPILEIYQPPRQGKSLPNCPRKIHGRDLYILQSDAYTDITSTPKPPSSEPTSSTAYPIAAGVIYNNHNHNTNPNPKKPTTTTTPPTTNTTTTTEEDEIYLPTTHQTYSATRTPRGNYRFILREKKTPSGETVIIEWRRKTQSQTRPRTASGSAVSGSTDSDTVTTTTGNPCEEEGDSTTSSSDANANANANPRFVLCVSAIGGERAAGTDQRVRRSGLAGLEKKGLRVGVWDAKQVRFLEEVGILAPGGEEEVITLVLTLGVYVAWMEGWL
ncbi:uncharacterized protein BO87DRAFT_414210 [Aspergillus neoniger CBS 115656]|uniref:Uncharacterized protein n=1 Tax=Aspergillus neoniger (strain CBS 115656) TaxID=1448310 RepID=A0A318YPH2_ASPNB|nr:hypothetical protein BO87DRAFT_414210 [Aspergillus neoniger CBS 115656]PYH36224.1 hypothetical protein BO87DRAFT_414210 [Aspergillus neoniger CBS 115656]